MIYLFTINSIAMLLSYQRVYTTTRPAVTSLTPLSHHPTWLRPFSGLPSTGRSRSCSASPTMGTPALGMKSLVWIQSLPQLDQGKTYSGVLHLPYSWWQRHVQTSISWYFLPVFPWNQPDKCFFNVLWDVEGGRSVGGFRPTLTGVHAFLGMDFVIPLARRLFPCDIS